jgi:uncharacterized damage-inducible protein DinB
MAIRESLLAEFDHEVAATRRVIRRVPDGKLDWRPHERSRSFGALIAHIAEVIRWSAHILDRERFDLDEAQQRPDESGSREALLDEFDGAAVKARALVDRSDAELAAPWSLEQKGHQLFTMPRAAAFRTFVLAHVVHHRGQLSVYLRLNDIGVPPIYGPTADASERQ